MPRRGLYRIPPEKEVETAISGVLEDYGLIASLASMTAMVNMRLSSENPAWRVSQRRVKRTAAGMRQVKMEIISSEREAIIENPACIVCSTEMKPVMNRTLYGDTVTLGYICPKCGYRTGIRRKVPVRYTFRIR